MYRTPVYSFRITSLCDMSETSESWKHKLNKVISALTWYIFAVTEMILVLSVCDTALCGEYCESPVFSADAFRSLRCECGL